MVQDAAFLAGTLTAHALFMLPSPRSHFLSPALPLSSFFFHWCLLTGASAEERVAGATTFTATTILKDSATIFTREKCEWDSGLENVPLAQAC